MASGLEVMVAGDCCVWTRDNGCIWNRLLVLSRGIGCIWNKGKGDLWARANGSRWLEVTAA